MTTDENTPLLASQEGWRTSDALSHDIDQEKQRRSNLLTIYMGFLGIFLASCDETLVMATYGAISSQFHSLTEGAWLVTSYNLGYCVSLPVYGTLSDIYGRRKPILSAYCLFAGGCVVSGLATSLTQLVVGRVISGIGGAGMIALVSVIITDLVPPGEVAVLRSYSNVAAVSGVSFGAPIGGLLTDTIGWRWSFIGQIPLVVVCFLLAGYRLPERTQKEEGSAGVPSRGLRIRDIDFLGIVTFTAAIVCLLLCLHAAGKREGGDHDPAQAYYFAVACVIFGVCFLLIEQFWAAMPVIPPSLLAQGVGGYCLVQILLMTPCFALMTNIEPYFTRTRNVLGVTASALLVPSCIGFSVGSVLSGQAIKRFVVMPCTIRFLKK
ncbi:hypothetical protein VTN02DRAFT_4406 [Thermoascus thermophilus]